MTAIERADVDKAPVRHTSLRIEDAAIDLFYERGFKSTTMREIALACGLTPGALYNHYTSKDQLLYTIIHRVHVQLQDEILEALDAAPDAPGERLKAYVYVHSLYHTRFRTEARVANQEISLLTEPGRAEIVKLRRDMRKLLKDLLIEGDRIDEFDVPEPTVTTSAILNMGIAIADWFRPDGRMTSEEVAAIHARLALRLAGAHEDAR
ncbi:MAG TPA: TetR/AcrR family transcriptional regulator [Actinomycetota bacterium]|nr:TetR/AcrR family transcriptional regulator [Actinomycetota bacterium]